MLAVLLGAVALAGAGLSLALSRHSSSTPARRQDAHESLLDRQVEKAIEARVPSGVTGRGARCRTVSAGAMTCTERIAVGRLGGGVATYSVTVNLGSDRYSISPVIAIQETAG